MKNQIIIMLIMICAKGFAMRPQLATSSSDDTTTKSKPLFVHNFEPVHMRYTDSKNLVNSRSVTGAEGVVMHNFEPTDNLIAPKAKLNEPIAIKVVQNVTICHGQTLNVGSSSYVSEGTYQDRLKASNGADSTVETHLTVEKLKLSVTNSVVVKKGELVQLNADLEETGQFAYKWLPGDGLSCQTCLQTEANPVETTKYQLYITDINGVCNVNAGTKVVVRDCGISIPDAFTPNADNLNDVFYVLSKECVKQIQQMIIYNETGGVVFTATNIRTSDPNFGWDGKSNGQAQKAGIYPYVVKVEFLDGEIMFQKGKIQLIR